MSTYTAIIINAIGADAVMYAIVRSTKGYKAWNGVELVEWSDDDIASYALPMRYKGGNLYDAVFPTTLVSGEYLIDVYRQEGDDPAIMDRNIGSMAGYWDGSAFTEPGSHAVLVTPLLATTNHPAYAAYNVTIAQGSAQAISFTLQDGNGNPVDLTGKSLRFVVEGLYSYETGSGITLSGESHNIVTVTHAPADTAIARKAIGWLWNITDSLPLAKVELTIEPAAKSL